MDFSFTQEQSMLRDSLARYLADHYSFDDRRAAIASHAGWRPAVWQAFAEELGILGASFAEQLGGFGGGPVENMIVMEELGKALVIEPYLPTVVIGGGFLTHGQSGRAADLAEAIISGAHRYAFAWAEPKSRAHLTQIETTAKADGGSVILSGRKAVVAGAPWATHLIVTARTAQGVGAYLVPSDAAGVAMRAYPTVDGGRAAEVTLDNVRIDAADALTSDDGLAVIETVVDHAIAALCAEAVGCMRQLHAGTLDYAKQRKQFGQPIASFQVLQHRMVDMFMETEQAVSMTMMATLKLGEPAAERAKHVSAAKAQIGKGGKFVGQSAVQIHGGMGMTDELVIGHYFKRLAMIESQFGSVDHHMKRFEQLSMGKAA
jgi:alkylation response protein AidB-like acyl-CoA dehydrogenase